MIIIKYGETFLLAIQVLNLGWVNNIKCVPRFMYQDVHYEVICKSQFSNNLKV